MFFRISYFLLISCLLSSSTFAKGLDNLVPAKGESQADNNKAADEPKNEEANITAASTQSEGVEKSEQTQQTLPNEKILLATSFGWAGLKKESNTWRAAGMSDISILYLLPIKIANGKIYTTFRYAPMDVAPLISKNGSKNEFVGVVEAYQFGGSFVYPLGNKKLDIIASGEIGYLKATLYDKFNVKDLKIPNESGVNMTIGGGAKWHLLPGVALGPKLYAGFGSFTTYQLTADASFSF